MFAFFLGHDPKKFVQGFVILLSLVPWAAKAQEPLSITAFDLPPYISSQAEGGGPVLDVLDRILRRLNIAYSIDFLPNNRAVRSVMEGSHDMIALVPMVGPHAVDLDFTDVLVVSKNYVFFRADGPVYSGNLKQLAAKRVGGLQAWRHDRDFQEFAAANNVTLLESRSPLTIVKLLQLQRVDAAIMPEDVGRWAAVAGPGEFRAIARSQHYMDISHLAMGMNWDSPFAEYLWDINAEIDNLKRSGELRLILETGMAQFLAAQSDD
ncbi:ABC-type amino acid transport substrate-binding protein [Aestuariispira insulae]|uniref:ABC-type amino acid transport substrate-binding protein n=2 Tax=Aestuariispira insulae TaxID=1461337 RepID=A0A3D9H7A7_9PROT|nr:ABC-type amino acid transport substrate-binding protein [Aestuariispira insulae]